MNGKISNLSQIAYVRRYTITDGREEGLKVVEVNNGVLRFMLNESKALDVMQLWHKGVNLSFVSKNGFTKRETPFLNRFEGGMIYTCGLDSVGGREGFELHGSFHNIPATIIECRCDETEIKVVAETYDTSLFGKNLAMRRTVTTELMSDNVCICDELVNHGTKEEDYALLYHINLGYPMLDKDTEIISDPIFVQPRNKWSEENLAYRTVRKDCVDNEEETCYFMENKTPSVSVVNKKLGKTFNLSYSNDTLPYFIQWNSSASQDYALGTEVATTLLDEQFKYSKIKAGEKITFKLKIGVVGN